LSSRWQKTRRWWGRLSLQARLAGAFALLAAGALIFLLAIIARTIGAQQLASGKIIPATVFVLAVFFLGGWLVARWCLDEISRLGARIREKPDAPLPAELEGLAALLRHEARQHDRLLQELRRFTADASHELRTPLTALRTVGESALRADDLPAPALRESIGSMLEEVRRMNALIDRLLRLARVESDDLVIEKRSVALAEQLQEWFDTLAVLAEERGVSLNLCCPADLRFATDPGLLGHAVLNLTHNAIEHSPVGGSVHLDALRNEAGLQLRIRDEGPGIPEEHHARLFERFYRVDPADSRQRGGFGLGLCIARGAVERLGGSLTLDDCGHTGAVFLIKLPVE
jgi:signal transduction histidine kinase